MTRVWLTLCTVTSNSDITNEMRQNYRESVLAVDKSKLISATEKYFMSSITKGFTSRVVFGIKETNKKALEKEGWKVTTPISILPS